MNCPHCHKEIPDAEIARHLASKGGSKKKNFSRAELSKRRKLMERINAMKRQTDSLEKRMKEGKSTS